MRGRLLHTINSLTLSVTCGDGEGEAAKEKKHLQQEFVDFLRAQTNVQMLFTLCAIVLCNNFFC
jgi:hypothetical protein